MILWPTYVSTSNEQTCRLILSHLQVNLIYLALLTQRVPIVGTFAPSHIGFNESQLPFGEIFDVQRLGQEIHTPVLEWRDVKNPASKQVELVGCWSPWAATGSDGQPRGNGNAGHFGIGMRFTPFGATLPS